MEAFLLSTCRAENDAGLVRHQTYEAQQRAFRTPVITARQLLANLKMHAAVIAELAEQFRWRRRMASPRACGVDASASISPVKTPMHSVGKCLHDVT